MLVCLSDIFEIILCVAVAVKSENVYILIVLVVVLHVSLVELVGAWVALGRHVSKTPRATSLEVEGIEVVQGSIDQGGVIILALLKIGVDGCFRLHGDRAAFLKLSWRTNLIVDLIQDLMKVLMLVLGIVAVILLAHIRHGGSASTSSLNVSNNSVCNGSIVHKL